MGGGIGQGLDPVARFGQKPALGVDQRRAHRHLARAFGFLGLGQGEAHGRLG